MAQQPAFDIDRNASVWLEGAPDAERCPALTDEQTADVAIIGGGFTGVSTAYHMSERYPDRRIVLLEARGLANGASGRNGGMMLNWINGVDMTHPDLTRRVYAATSGGIDGIEAVIRKHALPVRYRREGCLEVYTDARRAEAAHARAEEFKAWGIPILYLDRAGLDERLRLQGAVGALFDLSAGQINGVDLIRGMKRILLERGVGIYESTPVTRIREGATVTVEAPRGTVRAKAIVLATNGYTHHLGYFRGGVFPLHSHMIGTEPLSPWAWERMGWGKVSGFSDDLDRISYGSLTPDGRLVFGGGSNAAYDYLFGNRASFTGVPEKAFAAVQERLAGYIPATAELKITHRWTGTLGVTMSRVCAMGVRGAHKNVYYALGYSGHGVTLANLAGRVLCDLYSDHHDPWRDLPFYQRSMAYIPPEPLRWVGYHLYTRFTGRSPRSHA